MKNILMILSVFALGTSNANAMLKVNLLGGLNFADYSGSAAISPKAAGTYGATLQFGALPGFDFETGVLSVGKKTETSVGPIKVEASTRGWEVPFMLRFTALPVLDLGGGLYYAIVGDDDEADYGAKLSARARFGLAPMTDFLFDLSYNFGLKDLGGSAKTRDYAVLAGLSFGF